MSGVQHIEITGDEADMRLDRCLKRRFPQITQGMVEKFCRKGDLRLRLREQKRQMLEGQLMFLQKLHQIPHVQTDPRTRAVVEDVRGRLTQSAGTRTCQPAYGSNSVTPAIDAIKSRSCS